MWVRICLGALALGAWMFTCWMASHVSVEPEILGRWSLSFAVVLLGLAAFSALLTASHLPRVYRWIHAHRFQLLTLTVVCAVCLGAVELIVRMADPLGISHYAESRRYHLDKVADPELYYTHRANYSDSYQGVDCRFNELGFRDDPIEPRLPNEYRVLFVGDSITFGWGTPQRETFAARTAPLLSARMGRPVRAINGGCGSYNSVQECAFVGRYLTALAPDLVVLMYTSNDWVPTGPAPFDPWGRVSFAGKSPPESLTLLAYYSWSYRLVRHVYRYARAQQSSARATVDGPDWNTSFEHVAEAARQCRNAGVPFVVALWRMRTSPRSDAIALRLKRVAEDERSGFVDLGIAFKDKDPKQYANSIVDSHPNSEGHAVAARYLADSCEEQGVLRR